MEKYGFRCVRVSFRCILLCSNTKITFPKHMIFTCASECIKRYQKPSISPYISIINQAPRWRTISKAINAIKANASCDHERALHSQIRPSPPDTKMETINSTVYFRGLVPGVQLMREVLKLQIIYLSFLTSCN